MNTNNPQISTHRTQPGESSQGSEGLYLGFPSSVFTLDAGGQQEYKSIHRKRNRSLGPELAENIVKY